MTYLLDSQTAPLVSILKEKTRLVRPNPGPKLVTKPFTIGDFTHICNGFYRSKSLFIRIFSHYFGKNQLWLTSLPSPGILRPTPTLPCSASQHCLPLTPLFPPRRELSCMMVCRELTRNSHRRQDDVCGAHCCDNNSWVPSFHAGFCGRYRQLFQFHHH